MSDLKNIIANRISMDQQTIGMLREAGDDDQLVRLIDHSFTCRQKEPLEQLAEELKAMDFGHVSVSQPEGDYYLLECTSIDCTEFHSVIKTSVLMAILAKAFNVDYDGWGSTVASEEG